MKTCRVIAVLSLLIAGLPIVAQGRVWTDSTGRYTLDAELVAFDGKTAVLQRADHELVAIPVEKLSDKDREYLKSAQSGDPALQAPEEKQAWTLSDGTKLVGRVVDYATADMTVQRRRGRIYVNDRVLENLPEFYQRLVPQIVAHFERLQRADRRALESWLVRQRSQPRTFHLEGVVFELENGDEYAVPFFLFAEDDLAVLKTGWDEWLTFHRADNYDAGEDHAFLLRSLAAARHQDKLVKREIATMQLKLEAVQAGLTSLWEVTLYPAAGRSDAPRWVVVPGRDSRQATAAALKQNPGFVVGPIRRVAG
jgi:hypothetical protein